MKPAPLAATPAYLIAAGYLLLWGLCIVAGLVWTFATGAYRLLSDHADDYPWADYSEEDGPAQEVERGRKVGAL